jgi:hydroxymethylbilane synthase
MIKIGTRSSKLALWQAYHIQDLLKQFGLASEIITIETKGDKILEVTLSKIGSKGVFTEELEEALRHGSIDIAVHSAKDLPSALPFDLEIIAFTKREKSNDVLVSLNPALQLNDEDTFVIGTSSTRRNALLKHYYPHIKTVDMRGNLQTRMRKLEQGDCDAILLAYAGVHRMELDQYIVQHLDIYQFTPPVGQGTVAVEAAVHLQKDIKDLVVKATNDPITFTVMQAERAYLNRLEGGCSIPSFAMAAVEGDTLTIEGGIVSLDGLQIVRKSISGSLQEAENLGKLLAEAVLSAGGEAILKEIKKGIA